MSRSYLLGVVAGAAVLLAAQNSFAYDQLVVIGDSFSDTGNAHILIPGSSPSPPYFNGRFSNGPNYIDTLAAHFGVSPTASLLGGTNYGYASATTSATQPSPLGTAVVPPLTAQLGTYLGSVGGHADPNALYVVEGGTNDIFGGLLTLHGTSGSGAAASLASVAAAGANNIASIENQLVAAGARNLLTVNLPDLALEPITRASAFSGLANEASLAAAAATAFNADVASDLGAAPAGVTRSLLDLNTLTDAIAASPGLFGFTNITDPCIQGNGLAPAPLVCAVADENNHLFWDTVHFSARANDLFAATALEALPAQVPEPGASVALLSVAATLLLRRRSRAA